MGWLSGGRTTVCCHILFIPALANHFSSVGDSAKKAFHISPKNTAKPLIGRKMDDNELECVGAPRRSSRDVKTTFNPTGFTPEVVYDHDVIV